MAAVEAIVAQAVAKWGRVDILVNNAGVLRDKSFAKMTLDDFRFVVDVHLMGAVHCTKAVWELMRQQNYGRIGMTTSSRSEERREGKEWVNTCGSRWWPHP